MLHFAGIAAARYGRAGQHRPGGEFAWLAIAVFKVP